jgi:hypothetical protein
LTTVKKKGGPPSDAGDFAAAVNKMVDWLNGPQTSRFTGNVSSDVRQVAYGLTLLRQLLDSCTKQIALSERIPTTGIKEAYAILDHLRTGRKHPISFHVQGIHSGRFRPSRAPANALEQEARKVAVGVARAYAQVARISANAARGKVVSDARELGIKFTNDAIKKWDDRFRGQEGVDGPASAYDPGPDVWMSSLLRGADGDLNRALR